MADFGSLMNLIQNTIDPDGWQAAGGTHSMLPYPAGVWVDPSGLLRRLGRPEARRVQADPDSTNPVDPHEMGERPQPLVDGGLRAVSLKAIDEAVGRALSSSSGVAGDLIRLAGLTQIRLVYHDSLSEDVILIGPAEPQAPSMLLEDLAVVCGLIRQDTLPWGCTIEPRHDGLLRAQEYLSAAEASRLLSQSPRQFAARLDQLIGDHEVQVFGIDAGCSTAVALVAADEHMKRVGLGLAFSLWRCGTILTSWTSNLRHPTRASFAGGSPTATSRSGQARTANGLSCPNSA